MKYDWIACESKRKVEELARRNAKNETANNHFRVYRYDIYNTTASMTDRSTSPKMTKPMDDHGTGHTRSPEYWSRGYVRAATQGPVHDTRCIMLLPTACFARTLFLEGWDNRTFSFLRPFDLEFPIQICNLKKTQDSNELFVQIDDVEIQGFCFLDPAPWKAL